MKQDFDIDFVVPWVDGSDPEWIAEFNKYAPKERRLDIDSSEKRYRDYGLLRYWFCGVEKFAPWVRTVHFVTCGQKPDWLNLDAPKLHWVRHSDYIPQEYLPVFSANPIELMMHRISGLAEHFVYFNDDFFLTAPVKRDFFFKNRLPRDSAVLNTFPPDFVSHICMNDLEIINKHFSKRKVIKSNIGKWWNLKYGLSLIRTICLMPWPEFTGIHVSHLPQPFLKSTLEEVWEQESFVLSETMGHKFRKMNDVNQWLFRFWALCKGEFIPQHPFRSTKYFSFSDSCEKICSTIRTSKYKEIVINDCGKNEVEFYFYMQEISNAFESLLPDKSCFEVLGGFYARILLSGRHNFYRWNRKNHDDALKLFCTTRHRSLHCFKFPYNPNIFLQT